MTSQVGIRAGVDIGGTFTDIALEVEGEIHSTKTLTTPERPEEAILSGLEKAAGQAGIALSDIEVIIHGTTLATNALIERRGAKTALITTRGFRDVIEMRTENRFEQYDLNITLPPPSDRTPAPPRAARPDQRGRRSAGRSGPRRGRGACRPDHGAGLRERRGGTDPFLRQRCP